MGNDSTSNTVRTIGELPGAPKPVGPYSAAAECNGMIFLSGQLGLDPATGKLVEGGVEPQARQVMNNISAVLAGLGLKFENVIKTTIFLTDLSTFQTVNGIYGTAVGEHRPARSTIQVAALPLGGLVEIEMIAARP